MKKLKAILMKKIQGIVALLLCTVFCANIALATHINESASISVTLQENKGFMAPIGEEKEFNAAEKRAGSTANEINISLTPALNQANLGVDLNGFEYSIETTGDITQVDFNGGIGYVGVFEGYFAPDKADEALKKLADEDGMVSVIVDATYTETEMFAALTFGNVAENTTPVIVHFGEYTNAIRSISKAYAEFVSQSYKTPNANVVADEMNAIPRVQAQMKYQGKKNITAGSYTVGQLSVFFPDELINQNAMTIYAKVNADSSAMMNYIKNTYGYDTAQYGLAGFTDTAYISIGSRHVDLHATPNGYTPQNNETDFTVPLYFYLGKTLGVQSISVDVEVAKTTVKASKYSNSVYSNNTLEWEIYDGGGLHDIDGDYMTDTGMGVEAYYAMESNNVTEAFDASLRFTGAIRYYYTVVELEMGGLGDIYNYHIKSNTASLPETVRILPN